MEKEVICSLYTFSDDIQGANHKFYFEHKSDADIARFQVYCMFDKQRLTIKNFNVPVSRVTRFKVEEQNLKNFNVLTSYDDFQQEWFNLVEEFIQNEHTV